MHTQATCTEPALDYDGFLYLCKRCGQYTDYNHAIVNPITAPALGHDWGDWVIDGDNHYRLCQRDGCGARDEAAHSYGNWTYVDDNTCKGVCECGAEITDAHYDQYEKRCGYQPHCEKCDHDYGTISPHEMYYDPRSATEHKPYCYHCDTDFPLEAHSFSAATCVKGPICEKCGSEYGNPDTENGHSWDTDWTWDDKEHWHPCNNEGCEAKLDAEAHSAHDPEIEQPGKPATCTSPGTTDATFCSVCGAPISEQEIIEPLGHLLTPVAKVEPTCTAPGTEAYWKCTRDGCGMLFSDADGKNETSLEALTIPVDTNAHSWSTDWTKGDDTHYYACSQCEERKDEAAHTGGTATCTAKAKCTVCGAEYGDFAEHVYPANVWWGDENEHWRVCNVCDQPSAHEAHSGGTPTCTEMGKCEVCGNQYVDALGHLLTPVAKVEPTCTAPGTEAYWKCTRDGCGKLFSDADGENEITAPAAIDALGHSPVAVAGKEPTCTEAGLTEGSKCSLCGEVLKEQETIDALGHSPVAVAGKEPTCTETGLTEGSKCSLCGEVLKEQETINALGHTPVAVAGKVPTCTEAGLTEGSKCSLCGEVLKEQETIEALGHDWGEWEVTNEPQVGLSGVETRVCGRCGEAETASVEPLPEPEPAPAPEKPSSPNGVGIDIIARANTELPFTDVTKDMDIYDDVKYVYEKGIMDGMSDTLFGPELTLSRSMIVTLLWRLEGKPAVEYAGVFSDVPAGMWYTDGVEWAASIGLVLGYGDGTYGATDNVTREQLAAILYRYAQWKGYAVKTAALKAKDAEDVSAMAVEAMDWAVANGILRPDRDGNIRPGADATRAEIAKALHVFLENVAR